MAGKLAKSFGVGFLQDVEIWRNKTRIDNPLLCEEDGPVYQLRRWYEQFYVDAADVTEEMTQRFEFEVDTTRANEVWEQEVAENLARQEAAAMTVWAKAPPHTDPIGTLADEHEFLTAGLVPVSVRGLPDGSAGTQGKPGADEHPVAVLARRVVPGVRGTGRGRRAVRPDRHVPAAAGGDRAGGGDRRGGGAG